MYGQRRRNYETVSPEALARALIQKETQMTQVCTKCKKWAIPEIIEECEDSNCPMSEYIIPSLPTKERCALCARPLSELMHHDCSIVQCPNRLKTKSDGSTASYYELPPDATELQHLISYKNMNAQIGEIFRASYRYGESSHSDQLRDAKKIRFYADAEIERLEKCEKT